MGMYRKKPVVIEATQWFPGVEIEGVMLRDCNLPKSDPEYPCYQKHAYIFTLEGEMLVNYGDWIITGVQGEKYPCKPDIFAKTYEEVKPA